MKDLKKLKLSIPTLDNSECKTLMGGDGYGCGDDVVIGGDMVSLTHRFPSPNKNSRK